jgi:hypothetical protein
MVKLLLPTCSLFAQNAPRNRTSQDLPRRINAKKYTEFLIVGPAFDIQGEER